MTIKHDFSNSWQSSMIAWCFWVNCYFDSYQLWSYPRVTGGLMTEWLFSTRRLYFRNHFLPKRQAFLWHTSSSWSTRDVSLLRSIYLLSSTLRLAKDLSEFPLSIELPVSDLEQGWEATWQSLFLCGTVASRPVRSTSSSPVDLREV